MDEESGQAGCRAQSQGANHRISGVRYRPPSCSRERDHQKHKRDEAHHPHVGERLEVQAVRVKAKVRLGPADVPPIQMAKVVWSDSKERMIAKDCEGRSPER